MILDGVDYGHVWNSSGARGFFGDPDEYWYHKYWRRFGLDYTGYTFVAKTTTTLPRAGNMPLDSRWRPREMRPKCIVVKPVKGIVLNAVGLSGPGVTPLLSTNKWQHRTDPFVLSYMPTGSEPWEHRADVRVFCMAMSKELKYFRAPFALEVNLSCPNVDHGANNPADVLDLLIMLKEAMPSVPLIPKFNALEPVETAVVVASSSVCSAVAVGNTIPWGRCPGQIDWKGLFGSEMSPLAHLGGGGLSGGPLLPITTNWLSKAAGLVSKPIIAGGGIMSARDVRVVLSLGASAVEVGVVGMLRPWRTGGIRDAVIG